MIEYIYIYISIIYSIVIYIYIHTSNIMEHHHLSMGYIESHLWLHRVPQQQRCTH